MSEIAISSTELVFLLVEETLYYYFKCAIKFVIVHITLYLTTEIE